MSAAILYGDWGTSKAYVIGLAFAIAWYSSFWLIAAMCALTALVGFNYMIVCRHYPDGGGVYGGLAIAVSIPTAIVDGGLVFNGGAIGNGVALYYEKLNPVFAGLVRNVLRNFHS